MANIVVRLTSGHRIEFEIDTTREGPAFFVFGLPRSGSTLLNQIVESLAEANGIPFVGVGDRFFEANIDITDYRTDTEVLRIFRPGNAYGGFRQMVRPLIAFPLSKASPKILLVRDPRDSLVSQYFADCFSHPIPDPMGEVDDVKLKMEERRRRARSLSIDDYAIEGAVHRAFNLKRYLPILGSPTLCLLHYEDYIFDKPALIAQIAKHFSWRVDDEITESIMSWADIRPEVEDPTKMVRQVSPGDYLAKLQPRTIEIITQTLAEFMVPFGYVP
jgi:hypothetical protein